ncbi:MAG: FtsW/RodA/SpoVE family cell cycle protein, partial [Steroidobacteraceae bacterium]
MNTTVAGSSMAFARSSGRGGMVHIDSVTIALVLAIALLGLVMVTSASVSIASKESGQAFYYLERQLLLMLMGGGCAAFVFCIPTQALERLSLPLLITALILLFFVLVPG